MMIVRSTERKDANDIRSILVATNVFTHDEIDIATELVEIYLNDPHQNDYSMFSCVEGDAVVGYVCVGPTPATEATYDLYWIAVDPNVQGKGVGSSLLHHVEQYLVGKQCHLLIVETSSTEKYTPTRMFYEHKGFQQLARIKEYYRPNDDLIIYGKYL